MNEFFICLVKYTAIFICFFYSYTKLLRIKLKVWDLFDIPLFAAFSSALYFATVYVKIMVPTGLLVLGIIFLFLRFRRGFYETVTVGAISLGFSLVIYLFTFLVASFITLLFNFISNISFNLVISQLVDALLHIVCTLLLFRIKRFQSGINPKSKDATFDILLYISVVSIFTMTLVYAEEVKEYMLKVVILVIALCGLLLIVWWRRHITYNYRAAVRQQSINSMEDEITELKLNSAENELKVASYAKLIHYLNRNLPYCANLAQSIAEKTGRAEAVELYNMLQSDLSEMGLVNIKSALKHIPKTGVSEIDLPVTELFAEAERKKLFVSVDISADVESWFGENKLQKHDIHIMFSYLCDNAKISALGLPNANVRVELRETVNFEPLIRIYDSGEQFDEKVLAKLGSEQITTRAGVGGSGIGLFTVFEILAKYRASFTLDEAPQRLEYTKFIEIAFDGRGLVTVRTFRESVVEACAARKDMNVELICSDEEILRDGTNG